MAWKLSLLALMTVGVAGCGLFDDDDSSPAGIGGVGAACSEPRDCRDTLVCTGGTCQPSGTQLEGGVCQLSADCVPELYCNPARQCAPHGGAAAGDLCQTTGDCDQGLVCAIQGFYPRCTEPGGADIGQACTASLDCIAGLTCAPQVDGSTVCQSIEMPGVTELPPTPPQWSGVTCPASDGTPRAMFDVPGDVTSEDFFALPFPNDVRRTATGLDLSGFPTPSTAVTVDVMGRYVEAAERDLQGFATNPVFLFRFNETYDFGSVRGTELRLVDVDPASPGFGTTRPLSWLTTAGQFSNYACPNLLALSTNPGAPLLPGTTYAVLLFDGIVPADGGTFQRSSDLDALLADSAPSEARLGDHWPKYAPLRDYLADQAIDPATVLNATVFTTQEPEAQVPALRQVIRSGAAPTFSDLTVCDDGVVSPCDDGTPERSCGAADPDFVEIHGRVNLPIFQAGTPPYLEPSDGGGIETDGSGVPQVARTEGVCFALTIPAAATMPAAGWPVMVYAHGTGGSFRSGIANDMAADVATGTAPMATLAIDLPQHGERRGGSDRSPEELFFNFANPQAARDNVMQGAADLMTVAYAAQNLDLDAAASPTADAIRIDPSLLTLFAHSQGATHASLMLPYEPAYIAAVLSGNGGDLTESLVSKTEPVDVQAVLPIALLDYTQDGNLPLGTSHPALALWQTYFESVDPVNYAWRLHRNPVSGDPGRHVFMTYGVNDSFSTERTQTAYAWAARLTVVTPLLPDAVLTGRSPPTAPPPLSSNRSVGGSSWTIGLRQYAPPPDVDGHFVSTRSGDGRADVLRFLDGAAADAVPQIGM